MPRALLVQALALIREAALAGALVLGSGDANAQASLSLRRPALLASTHAEHIRLGCDKRTCPTLRVSQRWLSAPTRLGTPALGSMAVARATVGAAVPAGTSTPAPSAIPLSVGAHVTLRRGRELSLQLTPTPTRCAPLLSLRY
jgi:hypothetical protein